MPAAPRALRRHRPLLLRLALVAAVAAGLAATVRGTDGGAGHATVPGEGADGVRAVETAPVEVVAAGTPHVLHGLTRARQRVRLAFTLPGRMVERAVEVGDAVAPGQVLARLDQEPLELGARAARAGVRELDARLRQSRRDADRARRLLASGAATPAQEEAAASQSKALGAARAGAGARVDDAERLLEEATLRAPFAALVAEVYAEPGEVVGAGTPVVALSGTGAFEVALDAPERAVDDVVEGAPVTLRLAAGGPPLRGTVRSVARHAPGPGRLFPVLVDLEDDPRLTAGLEVTARIEGRAAPAPTVPLAAVVDPSGQRPAVVRVAGGRAERVPVTLGALRGERVQVRGDLAAGDRVVVTRPAALADGQPVEVR